MRPPGGGLPGSRGVTWAALDHGAPIRQVPGTALITSALGTPVTALDYGDPGSGPCLDLHARHGPQGAPVTLDDLRAWARDQGVTPVARVRLDYGGQDQRAVSDCLRRGEPGMECLVLRHAWGT